MEGLCGLPQLTSLDMSQNVCLTSDCQAALAGCSALQELSLDTCCVTDHGGDFLEMHFTKCEHGDKSSRFTDSCGCNVVPLKFFRLRWPLPASHN